MTKLAGREAAATTVQPASTAGDDPFGFSPWLKEMPSVALSPLMAHPVAAMAAATAIGFGLTSQIAGIVIGAMQGAIEQTKAALEEANASATPVKREAQKEPPENKKVPADEGSSAETRIPATVRKGSGPMAGKTDDLKRISGVGPKLEQALNGKGIFRFADIARWTASDAEKIEAELGLDGRIARDGWVEQARKLAKARG